ncbi:hypothetical protein BaRGS_00005193, partial [Batillaria attramentaria]
MAHRSSRFLSSFRENSFNFTDDGVWGWDQVKMSLKFMPLNQSQFRFSDHVLQEVK